MIPAFPIGATIPSILLAYAQTGRLSSVRQRVRGLPMKQPPSVLRCHDKTEVLAQHVFSGAFTSEDLLLHHTVSPIHLSSIEWRRIVDVAGPRLWALCSYKPNHLLSNSHMRLCPQCVEEDAEEFGCGHWRREHQIRFVQICTRHLTVLHDKCASENCGASFTRDSHILPGQPCPSCQGTETSGPKIGSISAGYLAFCKLFTDALVMRIPELDPEKRFDLCNLPRALCSGDVNAFSQVLGGWIGNQLGIVANEWAVATDFLRSPYQTVLREYIAPSLMLLAAFKREMFGAPPESEILLWRDRTRSSSDLLQMS